MKLKVKVSARERQLEDTLRWIIERIEEEADKSLSGKRPEWKKAATECVEEAYGVLGRVEEAREAAAAKREDRKNDAQKKETT